MPSSRPAWSALGRVVAYAETGQSGVAEIAPSWSPRVYRFRGARVNLLPAEELASEKGVDHISYGKLIIGGWSVTFAMIGFYALQQSGSLLKLRRRMRWLEPAPPRPPDTLRKPKS